MKAGKGFLRGGDEGSPVSQSFRIQSSREGSRWLLRSECCGVGVREGSKEGADLQEGRQVVVRLRFGKLWPWAKPCQHAFL